MSEVSPLRNYKYEMYCNVDTLWMDSYLDSYLTFPDTVQLPVPFEVHPLIEDNDEAGNPQQGQDPSKADKGEQDQGNPTKCLCLDNYYYIVCLLFIILIGGNIGHLYNLTISIPFNLQL